jgi:hypothetical protein
MERSLLAPETHKEHRRCVDLNPGGSPKCRKKRDIEVTGATLSLERGSTVVVDGRGGRGVAGGRSPTPLFPISFTLYKCVARVLI